jgi:molybdenum cofactor cytidylyltransferase
MAGAPYRIAAVILAAGRSTRALPANKLLLRDAQGRTMLGRVVTAALGSLAAETVVVTGHMREKITEAAVCVPGAAGLRFTHAANYADGMSASLIAGITAVPHADAALICLGDMPLITPAIIDTMIGHFDPVQRRSIVVPTCGGAWGNPVLWDRRYFPEILHITGDAGARSLLSRFPEERHEVELDDVAVLRDFDTSAGFF